MLISSFLKKPFTDGPSQDVSCELNKGILAQAWEAGFQEIGHHVYFKLQATSL